MRLNRNDVISYLIAQGGNKRKVTALAKTIEFDIFMRLLDLVNKELDDALKKYNAVRDQLHAVSGKLLTAREEIKSVEVFRDVISDINSGNIFRRAMDAMRLIRRGINVHRR